ncbi:hypothetical protein Pint_29531 [Pistacia integerrima]|uniref:Uncharacterized protein n=1 Tax=Pistacia integerrima TaxID=434235 RepID=A0ACC0X1T4_9ROSI|nr:hypothetical protein Pint_29531 [Pistacia integerrima]
MWDEMGVVRVYTKPQGQQPDFSDPVVLSVDRGGCTVEEMPAYDPSTHIEHGREKVNPDGNIPIWSVQPDGMGKFSKNNMVMFQGSPIQEKESSFALQAAYIAVMRNATTDRRGFESLLKFYKKADAVEEKELILQAIACSPDPDMVAKVLNFLVSDDVQDQDDNSVLGGISLEGQHGDGCRCYGDLEN